MTGEGLSDRIRPGSLSQRQQIEISPLNNDTEAAQRVCFGGGGARMEAQVRLPQRLPMAAARHCNAGWSDFLPVKSQPEEFTKKQSCFVCCQVGRLAQK